MSQRVHTGSPAADADRVVRQQSTHPTVQTSVVSLRLKLLVGFTLLFTLVFTGAFYWFYNFATDRALLRIEEDLVDTARGAAAGIDGDLMLEIFQEVPVPEEGLPEDPRWLEHMNWLQTVQNIEPRAWPYTYVRGEQPNEIIAIGDLWLWYDSSRAYGFKESDISTKGFLESGLRQLTLRTYYPGDRNLLHDPFYRFISNTFFDGAADKQLTPYTDRWGNWVSAYAPVRNAAGEIVGAVGIDFRADYVYQVQQAIQEKIFIAFAVVYGLLFLLVYLASRTFTRPIVALTAVAQRIGEGDYDHDFAHLTRSRIPDEITTLAQVFAIMVDKVRQREQKLIRQVEELRIEIDEVKRQKQVSEIVDSDFFQELQTKASEMRSRRRSK